MFGFRLGRKETKRHEPQVFFRSDNKGNTWWDIYNPSTGLLTRVATEDEARLCIEQDSYNY